MQICFIVKSCLFSVRITSIIADLPQWFNDDFYFWAQKQCEGGKNDGTCKKQHGFRLSVRIYSENCNLGSLGFSANGNDAAPSAIPGMAERGTAAAG